MNIHVLQGNRDTTIDYNCVIASNTLRPVVRVVGNSNMCVCEQEFLNVRRLPQEKETNEERKRRIKLVHRHDRIRFWCMLYMYACLCASLNYSYKRCWVRLKMYHSIVANSSYNNSISSKVI